jgi:hypothetical protein
MANCSPNSLHSDSPAETGSLYLGGFHQQEQAQLYLFDDLLLLSKKDPEIGYDALVSAAGAGTTKIVRKLLDESFPADPERPVGATDPVANKLLFRMMMRRLQADSRPIHSSSQQPH